MVRVDGTYRAKDEGIGLGHAVDAPNDAVGEEDAAGDRVELSEVLGFFRLGQGAERAQGKEEAQDAADDGKDPVDNDGQGLRGREGGRHG